MAYAIVNKDSGRPIFAIGFCSCYTDKTDADKAANTWNSHKSPSRCEVKVVETK